MYLDQLKYIKPVNVALKIFENGSAVVSNILIVEITLMNFIYFRTKLV